LLESLFIMEQLYSKVIKL